MKRLDAVKGKVSEGTERIRDDVLTKAALRLRSDPRMLERWRSYTGAETDQDIDYDDPCVQIEFICCDPSMLMLAAGDGPKFMARTGCDPEVFLRYYDQSAESP